MVFSSDTFLFFFLPVCVLVYALIRREARNAWLLAMSLLFYAWGGGAFLLWLLGSIGVNWVLGLVAERAARDGKAWTTRLAIGFSAAVNMLLLGWFKYANFVVEQLTGIAPGWEIEWERVTLPIGISFFTFQALSYVIDVARGGARALKNPMDFALYVSLFPQLIAGPIVRYHEIASQMRQRSFTLDGVTSGLVRFAHGLCKKVLVADSAGLIADTVFNEAGGPATSADAWIGMFAYTVQIYFDFSGYSDMAIGLGRVFGFTIPENFKRPYSATSMTDFWRRWHVTLSSWFRDYVYIPLGGSRSGTLKTYRNLVIVFLATGIWHGAAWTFVLWGVYHGAWLVIERLRRGLKPTDEEPVGFALFRARAFTLLLVMIGWVLFRANGVDAAGQHYLALLGTRGWEMGGALALEMSRQAWAALAVGAVICVAPGGMSWGRALDERVGPLMATARLLLVCVLLPAAIAQVLAGTFSPFLYFRF
ncbi:MAG: MBOAT family protein [Planctomycetota bacterium]